MWNAADGSMLIASTTVRMNDFLKGLGSVALGGLVGSCLGAAAFLAIEAPLHIKALMPPTAEAQVDGGNQPRQ